MRQTKDSLVVSNQEYFTTWSSSWGGDIGHRVSLSPADVGVFSWLAHIARCYTYYRWKKLRICWQSYASTSTAGDVMLGLFYDKEDIDRWFLNPNKLQNLSQTVGASSGPVWASTLHNNGRDLTSEIMAVADVSRAHARTNFHLVDDSLSGGFPTDNQSVAVFLGAVVGANQIPATSETPIAVGRIWIDYEIELLHPTAGTSHAPIVSLRGYDPERDTVVEPAPWLPRPRPNPTPPEPTSRYCDADREVQT